MSDSKNTQNIDTTMTTMNKVSGLSLDSGKEVREEKKTEISNMEVSGLSLEDENNKELSLYLPNDAKVLYTGNRADMCAQSTVIKTALESDPNASTIPMATDTIKPQALRYIMEYIAHHENKQAEIIEKPLRSKIMRDVCKDEWDAKFIDTIGETRQDLYDLILAANYMDISPLLHLGCAKVASLIKGQPLEKIKAILATDEDALDLVDVKEIKESKE